MPLVQLYLYDSIVFVTGTCDMLGASSCNMSGIPSISEGLEPQSYIPENEI